MDIAQNKFGWRVSDWGQATSISRSRVYELLAEGLIESVWVGSRRIIITHPKHFLDTQVLSSGRVK